MSVRKYSWLGVWVLLFISGGLLLMMTTAVSAQEQDQDVTDDEVNAVAKQLFCPTCENTPVDVCPTQTCSDWRADIRQQLAEGRSEPEILAYFADYYGPEVLASPPREGFGLVAWYLPVVVVLVAVVGFGWYFYRLQQAGQQQKMRTATTAVVPNSPLSENSPAPHDKYRDELEQELKK